VNGLPHSEMVRLRELLIDEQFDQLDISERAELESLLARAGLAADTEARGLRELRHDLMHTLDGVDAGSGRIESLPDRLRHALVVQGERIVTGLSETEGPRAVRQLSLGTNGPKRRWPAASIAAGLILAGAVAGITLLSVRKHAELQQARKLLTESQSQVAAIEARVGANEALLTSAQKEVDRLNQALAVSDGAARQHARDKAEAAAREVLLARQLAEATRDLDEARLQIATLEAPIDPATIQQNRTKLLEVPGTVRLAWAPFDLPESKAEKRDVQGDVVWNDERQEGYLRFVGLDVNDPAVEQYQVWVIDERGMEQKVSGGVFNATAAGEIIVPIHPGIDVGRVALFAVTVEEPGGTWVPDLRRRVVVAPRDAG
jgi:hypothetical protein